MTDGFMNKKELLDTIEDFLNYCNFMNSVSADNGSEYSYNMNLVVNNLRHHLKNFRIICDEKNDPFYDPSIDSRMPYGAYGKYEQHFYDKKISRKDFYRVCREFNYGNSMTIEQLRERGIKIDD